MKNTYNKIIIVLFFAILSTNSFAQNTIIKDESDQNKDSITLILKADGLEIPSKESGKTEYEVADMNNDGFLDIISVGDHGSPDVNSGQHGIMVWLGDGGNYWDVHQSGEFGYGGCAIGDLNLDGINDVAWGVHHNYASGDFGDSLIEAALGDGTGSNWTSWDDGLATSGEYWGMFATDLADFDIDGDLDIISQSFGCCNGIQIYENLGNGSWAHAWGYTGGNVLYNVETGDFNADGYPDFICTHWDFNVFLGAGNLSFTNVDSGLPVGLINAVDVADMNDDGYDDVVVGLASSQGVRCYLFNDQTEEWTSHSTGLPSSNNYDLVQFGDINGDEHNDIVCYKDNIGTIYLGDGMGVWTEDASWNMPEPGDYSAMRVDGDVDFDGREDIVIQAAADDYLIDKNCLRLYSPWEQPTMLSGYVKKPHGGETFFSDSVTTIKWLSKVPLDEGIANVTIMFSEHGSSGPWTLLVENYTNSGSYQWVVEGNTSDNCRIIIILYTENDSFSMISDDDFSIISTGNSLSADSNGPYSAEPQETITFTGSAIGGEPPYTWSWDFGDGNTSTQQNPQHAFVLDGTYNVTLTVTDNQYTMDTDSTFAVIQESIIPPIADFYYIPLTPSINDSISFIDNSIDADGSVINWTWDFGDGNMSFEKNPMHQYTVPSVYEVCLTVRDEDELFNTSCKLLCIYGSEVILDVNQSMYDRGFPIRHALDGDWAAAQSFIATINTLTSTDIYMRKFGTPEFNLTVELRKDHPQGTLISNLSFSPDEVPTAWDWFPLDFTDTQSTPDTEYFIVCPPAPSGVTTSFGYEWGYAFGDLYDGGAFWFTRDCGGLWRDLPTMYEFTFRTYGYS